MNTTVNPPRIFTLCCISLIVTAMTFAIRAGILGQLGAQFSLSDTELGWINAMAFWGFPTATIFGGVLYNLMGAKRLITLAFVCHVAGLVLTILADGFWGLIISSFMIGFANGAVEAGCNPLIASTYHDRKVTMLNRFHVWFPGGIVIGALLSTFMDSLGFGWQEKVAMILLPSFIYGYMIMTTRFPEFGKEETSTLSNIKGLISPLYLFLIVCMTLTATTELGTQQWIEKILGSTGVSPMLILAMITGLMAVGRFYAGPVIHRLNPNGVLLGSAILAASGIFMMSQASGMMIYVAAILFALGCTYFWPTMVGAVAVYTPQTGALGMSLLGGAGMFAAGFWNPVIGGWFDAARSEAHVLNPDPAVVEVIAGQQVLLKLFVFPIILIVAFSVLYWMMRRVNAAATVR
jgi:fucose permease